MRSVLFLAILILLGSCSSVNRLVEKGNYREALEKGLKKYSKSGNLKNKEVEALEHAFNYVIASEIKQARRLAVDGKSSWNNVYKKLENIDYIQNSIKRDLPIVSRKGYTGRFDFISVGRLEEEVFNSAQQRDLSEIQTLKSKNTTAVAEQIYLLYQRIDQRQHSANRSSRIVSDDGYRAKLKFENVSSELNQAKETAFEYEFEVAKRLLDKGKRGDKYSARRAYELFEGLANFGIEKDKIERLKQEADYFGTNRILLVVSNQSRNLVSRDVEREILGLNLSRRKTEWNEIFYEEDKRDDIDIVAQIVLTEAEVGPSVQDITHYRDEKKIEDGWKYKLDTNGNVMKDSLGNDIKVKNYSIIYADVDEVVRHKEVFFSGKLVFRYKDGETFRTDPVHVDAVFDNRFAVFRGDKRALSSASKRKIRNIEEPFPRDYDLIMKAARALKFKLQEMINRANL